MQLIAADILTEAHGLSYPFCALGLALGALLWLFGWRWHRFWVVLGTTVTAGLIGLSEHQVVGPRMLAAGVLLAVAAGIMAIDLSRIIAFSASGLACWLVVQRVLPHFQEPMICFLIGGIFGLFLYRLLLMVLSSLAGTLLFGHSLVLLVEKIREASFPAAQWTNNHALGLNISVVIIVLTGIALQGRIEWWLEGRGSRRRNWLMSYLTEDERQQLASMPRQSGLSALFRPR